jgi:hypothetical protein
VERKGEMEKIGKERARKEKLGNKEAGDDEEFISGWTIPVLPPP